jgi:hypothetical protein
MCSSCGYNLTMLPMGGRCPECGSGVSESLGVGTSIEQDGAFPTCAKCNYSLNGLRVDGRCPECGLPVRQSLGVGRQIGAPWERARSLGGRRRAWRKTAAIALLAPEQLGRMIRLAAPSTHRSFLAMHLPLILLIAPIALILHIMRVERVTDLFESALIGCVSATFGLVCTLAAFGVVNLAALLVGLLDSCQTKRNMLPAAIQIACYLTPYVVAWELLGAVVTFWLTKEASMMEALAEMIGVLPELLAMALFLVLNFLVAGVYLHLIARGTKAARYANK